MTTPFKIHDENQFSSSLKDSTIQRKGLGFGNDSVQKKGLNTGVKSTRKALSSLSTSEVNVRLTAPTTIGRGLNNKDKLQSKTHQKPVVVFKEEAPQPVVKVSKPKIEAESYYVDDFTMVCCFIFTF
jgi:hypothetical protein